MVAQPDDFKRMTESEYLAFERTSETKHEYLGGEVFAMTGGSENHSLIGVNVITSLRIQTRGRPCKIYNSDLRVRVNVSRMYSYPDITIVCGEARFADDHQDTLLNPTVVIEVLSPSTEIYDRGKKFQQYRTVESLQQYLIISQTAAHIECYTRQADGVWELRDVIGLDAQMELPPIGCVLTLGDVYEQVVFPAAANYTDSR